MVLPQDILWGCRPLRGLPTYEGLIGSGGFTSKCFIWQGRWVAAGCCQEATVLLSEGFHGLLACPHSVAVGLPQSKQAIGETVRWKMQCFLFHSLGGPIPSLSWCPIGNTSQPCSLWVVTIQGHQYQEIRILWGAILEAWLPQKDTWFF